MPLRVVLAGGSGFLGTQLREALTTRGHTVTRLVRRPAEGAEESTWDPYAGEVDAAVIAASDVVVNLAGSPTAGNISSDQTVVYVSVQFADPGTELPKDTVRQMQSAVAPADTAGVEGLTYAWTRVSGPNVTLNNATTLTPTFFPSISTSRSVFFPCVA